MNFTSFGTQGLVEGYCVIKAIEKKMSTKGSVYLDMTLADSSGEINAKLWDYKDDVLIYHTFDFVKVRGLISMYKDTPQLRVDRIRHVIESDGVDVGDYVESAVLPGEIMLRQIEDTVNAFSDEELKKLVLTMLDKNREQLLVWPAAFRLHHAIRGGLLMHTITILHLAKSVADIYGGVNKDLLYTGVILHDIAKIQEIGASSIGVPTEYTARGNLIGHLVMGAIDVDAVGKSLGISEEKLNLVEHMLISHHGQPEFGVAQLPMFLEAVILSELDLLDARVYEINKAVEAVEPGAFTGRQKMLDDRKLYNHGLGGKNTVNIE